MRQSTILIMKKSLKLQRGRGKFLKNPFSKPRY
ncbi:hypothetical protein CBUD_1102a [Coxiella burnetii Dugway 5J108-111]|uniref:Uncharacterized protein n=1 Tax=Coxiella burnetii (strain Dugway 5J108-111) TaxID=434922 RepID=B5XHC3_COXBN|nr:hypothetical protein CBUD_1102a [Coxiella burnetii Dugway 5J108-111]